MIQRESSYNSMVISHLLVDWYETAKRDLPWRHTQDPYRIWLSETILQQTRIAQGLPYYLDFTESFPTVHDLADASEDEVLSHWQGLGYYSRARNLHATARYVSRQLQGAFPSSYEGLLSLKGIGPYTAAAIASFSFGLPCPVLDGNVFRVIARLLDIDLNILDQASRKTFEQAARELMDPSQAALHNQAMMELGALVCKPQQPDCGDCPLAGHCLALAHGTVVLRPVRHHPMQKKQRFLHYLCLSDGARLAIYQRQQKDIWHHLWEFPLLEHGSALRQWEELLQEWPGLKRFLSESAHEAQPTLHLPVFRKHILSHQRLEAACFAVGLSPESLDKFVQLPGNEAIILIPKEEVSRYAFSALSSGFISKLKFL